jgi:hypothetical protein
VADAILFLPHLMQAVREIAIQMDTICFAFHLLRHWDQSITEVVASYRLILFAALASI